MQLNLGNKIRELRRRDGRTQEALAEAIGVTSQAVSRWESGGSYPDMETIPAIANYFHISIDELFGYHDDREEKIRSILHFVDGILIQYAHLHQGCLSEDVYECIKVLRTASEEFPNEPKILLRLAQALHMWGWHKYGAKVRSSDQSDTIELDIEYNSQNTYWQEAMRVYEKVLKSNPSPNDRETAIRQITPLYCRMGEYEKAKALANDQNSIIICKELLLPCATVGEENARYQGERITALLSQLQLAICESIALKPSVSSSEYGRELLLSVIHLYETIFADGRFGSWHGTMGRLYLTLVNYEMGADVNSENILVYFDKAFDHFSESVRIYNEGDYSYSAPLLSNLKPLKKGDFTPSDMAHFWKKELMNYPSEICNELRKNEKYAECFA